MGALSELPRVQVLTHDLLQVIVHECGHAIIADATGGKCFRVDVWLRSDADPDEEKLVGGEATRTLQGNVALIGVAGIVATELANNDPEFFSALDLVWDIEDGELGLSDTDRKAAGKITESLLDECADLLRRHWPALIKEALHFVRMFQKQYEDDADAVAAASAAWSQLFAMRNRFALREAA